MFRAMWYYDCIGPCRWWLRWSLFCAVCDCACGVLVCVGAVCDCGVVRFMNVAVQCVTVAVYSVTVAVRCGV